MSHLDSGTKNRHLLRLLSVLLLAVLLFTLSAVAVAAKDTASDADTEVTSVDDGKFPSGYEKLKDGASQTDRLMYGLQVAGIGILMVFLVLVIIMAILYVFKLVAVTKTKKAAPAVAPAAAAPAVAPKETAPAVAPAAPATSGSEEETIVAIATAAIAASRGASDCAFKVISVTKIQ